MRLVANFFAGLLVWSVATSGFAQTNVFLAETEEVKRILVSDPFSPRAMETLGTINQVRGRLGGSSSPVLSIDNLIERRNFNHPTYGQSFWVSRVITFDLDALLRQADAALEPYRKNGCSKFRISAPSVISVDQQVVRLRVNMSFKKRACDRYLGTHDLASGHGHAILSARLVDVEGQPDFVVSTESVDIDTDSVLGIDPNSLFGRITRLLTVDLAKLLGRLSPGGTIGELQSRLVQPLTSLTRVETVAATEAQYSPTQISAIVRGYGSLSRLLDNVESRKLGYSHEDSGVSRQRIYALRPEFVGEKDPSLCSALGPGGLNRRYCTETPASRLVLRVVQRSIYSQDARPWIEEYYTKEAVYLGSLSQDVVVKYYPSHVQLPRIVDEHYLSQAFRPFFLSHNAQPDCTRETSPGRPRSAGELWCAYRIVPAWRRLEDLARNAEAVDAGA
jgi:hypothetical protein